MAKLDDMFPFSCCQQRVPTVVEAARKIIKQFSALSVDRQSAVLDKLSIYVWKPGNNGEDNEVRRMSLACDYSGQQLALYFCVQVASAVRWRTGGSTAYVGVDMSA